ncbi:MAG: RNA-binding protein [Patescibacteria group bacterium]
MQNKIYVGNLSYSIDDAKLKELFSLEGLEISEAKVITDKFSGRSKGFGFVTFAKDEMAQKAISEMEGKEVDGRALKVNIARPMEERPSSGRGFNRNFR